jgi:ribonuclease HI
MAEPDSQALQALNPSAGFALYTDGSSSPKDKSGGWAWLALDNQGGEVHACGAASNTTNNRMEMTAWIEGLLTLRLAHGPCLVVVFSDSEYVGLGFKDENRQRKANADLWEELDRAAKWHEHVEFQHVKGHAGDPFNEEVDLLAVKARKAAA